jgi:hypothetical protein
VHLDVFPKSGDDTPSQTCRGRLSTMTGTAEIRADLI